MRSSTPLGSPVELVAREIPHVEGVCRRSRRMLRRVVERREVVVVELDLGAFGDPIAQADEDVDDLGDEAIDEVTTAQRTRLAGQRHVDGVGRDALLERRSSELLLARVQRLLQRQADLVGGLADGGALLRRQRAEPSKHRRQRPLLAEDGDAHRVERGEVACLGDGLQPLVALIVQFLHDSHEQVLPSLIRTTRSRPRPWIHAQGRETGSRGTTSVGPRSGPTRSALPPSRNRTSRPFTAVVPISGDPASLRRLACPSGHS